MIHVKANFSHFGKEQYRRSILPESVVDFVDEQIKQEITLIDLGQFSTLNSLERLSNDILQITVINCLFVGNAANGVYQPKSVQEEKKLNRVQRSQTPLTLTNDPKSLPLTNPNELNVGYILCHGNVTNFDTMIRHFTTSIKSILIFSSKKIRFRIVTDDLDGINEMIFENIPEKYWPDFDVRGDNTSKDMWDLKDSLKFKGCGHLKMTFHHTFGDVDSLLLLDADTLLLNPIEGIAFNSTFRIIVAFTLVLHS